LFDPAIGKADSPAKWAYLLRNIVLHKKLLKTLKAFTTRHSPAKRSPAKNKAFLGEG